VNPVHCSKYKFF